MNHGKTGPPYRLAHSYIQLLSTVRHLYSMPYRQLEGFTRALHGLVPQLPPGDFSGLRKRILALNPDYLEALRRGDEPMAIAVDSTGVKVHRAGDWVERKHDKKKRYVKLHFAIDVETKKVVALEVSTDDVHDIVAIPKLVAEAEKHGRVSKALGDGAYDSGDVFMMLEERSVGAVIKPRRNSRLDTPSPARRRAVRRFRDLGYEAWAKLKGYGRRWMAETAFSTFKRLFESTAWPGPLRTSPGSLWPRSPSTTGPSTCEAEDLGMDVPQGTEENKAKIQSINPQSKNLLK